MEADVINLIGYETPMEFVFVSEGIATFQTVFPEMSEDIIGNELVNQDVFKDNFGLPLKSQYIYQVEFFGLKDSGFEFFRLDSFSHFLEKYQIFRVLRIDDVTGKREQIYFKQYQEE